MMIWLILGIFIGCGLYWLYTKIKAGSIAVTWYQWLLGFGSTVLFLLTIQNIFAFQVEMEPVAAKFTMLAMGLPAVILGVLAYSSPKLLASFKTKPGEKATISQ